MTTQTVAVTEAPVTRTGTQKTVIRALVQDGLIRRGVHRTAIDKYVPWGEDNRGPQRTLEAVAASGTASVCVALKAKFIEGNGFKNVAFAKTVINRHGLTVDGLVRKHSPDLAGLEGFAVLLNVNGLGNPCEVFYAPLAQWRAAQPEADGATRYGYLLNNLSTEAKKYTNSLQKTNATRYRLFDPAEKPEARVSRITAEMAAEGKLFTEYPGELYVFTHQRPGANVYPRPVYDAVLRDLLTEASLKVSRHRDVRDGFATQAMVTEYGTAEPTQKKLDDDGDKYQDFVSEDGARLIVQYAVNKDSKPDIDLFTVNNSSDRYAKEEESIRRNIRATFQIPDLLYGDAVAGKLGTADEFDDAVKYVQTLVINSDQRAIEEFYSAIFSQFQPAGVVAQPGINTEKDYAIQNLSLKPPVEAPSEAQKTIENLKALSPLVQTKILNEMTPNQVLGLAGLPPYEGGDVRRPATTDGDPTLTTAV